MTPRTDGFAYTVEHEAKNGIILKTYNFTVALIQMPLLLFILLLWINLILLLKTQGIPNI